MCQALSNWIRKEVQLMFIRSLWGEKMREDSISEDVGHRTSGEENGGRERADGAERSRGRKEHAQCVQEPHTVTAAGGAGPAEWRARRWSSWSAVVLWAMFYSADQRFPNCRTSHQMKGLCGSLMCTAEAGKASLDGA